jgi:RimJ/RimL family protein N-acetyltransferase
MTAADVPAVVAVQEPGAVAALVDVFPQDEHPFPREEVAGRWVEELGTPGIDCYVVEEDGAVVGFAASRGDELFHLGVAVERWGTGVARAAHDALLARMRGAGVEVAWLRVFEGNARGRRFYERLGWVATGERSRSTFPPRPVLLRYELALSRRGSG